MKNIVLAVTLLFSTAAFADGKPISVPQSDLPDLSANLVMAIRGCGQQPDTAVLQCAERVLITAQKLQQELQQASQPPTPPAAPGTSSIPSPSMPSSAAEQKK